MTIQQLGFCALGRLRLVWVSTQSDQSLLSTCRKLLRASKHWICHTATYLSRVVRKLAFCICENKVTAQLISAFVFAIRIVQSLYYLNPKFQAFSHLVWLYSPVCIGPGRKPRRPVFSQRGSFFNIT